MANNQNAAAIGSLAGIILGGYVRGNTDQNDLDGYTNELGSYNAINGSGAADQYGNNRLDRDPVSFFTTGGNSSGLANVVKSPFVMIGAILAIILAIIFLRK